LFHVVNERHLKKRPMIFTTNQPLAAWGSALHDRDLAEAIIDRILERGRFIALDGPSSRTRHLKAHELGRRHRQSPLLQNRPEFPKKHRQNFRHPHDDRCRPPGAQHGRSVPPVATTSMMTTNRAAPGGAR
jgi:hypothetical protein